MGSDYHSLFLTTPIDISSHFPTKDRVAAEVSSALRQENDEKRILLKYGRLEASSEQVDHALRKVDATISILQCRQCQ